MSTVREILKEHIEWRHQVFKLAKADIVKTYSGAALGWAWAIIKPTITILVFWFAFSIGLRMGGKVAGFPYILWLIAGMVPWFYMSEMITQGAGAIRKYRYLVTKMKFPVSTIPTFVSFSKFTVHLFLLGITLVIFALFGYLPDLYLLQLPFYMLAMLMFFIEWSLFSAMLSSVSQDFLNLVKSIVTPIFWLSGIMWDVHKIDIGWLKTLLMFNPVTYVSTGYRNTFIYKIWFWEQPRSLLYFCIIFLIMTIAAVWSYRKLIKEIPDVL
ncbi:ABC transporter permease [Anaerovorax odorimutans]|uniref:Transport permease protein n=1 Tax=Anaerovorax odorimutans TaxID=109327 RepID=A0ABT1RJB4_9FIRM|nr:ABC transporter permease [Anaerovorax odorimutans]MCQ4635266.1 ABC transporter permease [Anaerovorax odorimutans]